nr:S9 family peptidase [Coralloluteibacterium stylophorae]
MAAIQPYVVTAPFGAERQDEYYWLRDDSRENPDVLDYLRAENDYADQAMAPLANLRETLYQELIGRIVPDDTSVPYRKDGYWYYTRFVPGQEYPVHARRKGSMQAPEEVLLDLNALSQGKSFLQIPNWEVSPDQALLAYVEDTVGRRQYTLRIKDIATGALLPESIPGLAASIEWAADGRSLYYVENDPATLLTKRVRRHVLGTDPAEDELVYEETDEAFYMGLMHTRSEKYICIGVESTVSTEQRCTESAAPGEFRLVAPRERNVEYFADHLDGRWVIRTNRDAPNFKLMEADEGAWEDAAAWRQLVAHDAGVLLEDVVLFNGFMALAERSEGLSRLRVIPEEGEAFEVAADEPAYAMDFGVNAEPGSDRLRYTYTSPTTPETTYELDIATRERALLKEQPVQGGFVKSNYVTERRWANSRDGVRIPVTLLYRRGFERDGTAALLQYGYGAYGSSTEPRFNPNVLSLVDRGMVYAIAHVRGGEEMGRAWYEGGRLTDKQNSFNDFIDVTRFLVGQKYAAPNRVAAMGGSAGGLLMGAVANQAPDNYRAIVSLVPFVDVVTTMLDPTIPLTTNEYDEWGNPEQQEAYETMLAYSPYDHIEAKPYPAMFVGTGLWDSQVQYWEPAKYVARLRARRTDNHLLVLRTNMQAGHGGKSGRFQKYREVAEYYAFLLDQLGVAGPFAPTRALPARAPAAAEPAQAEEVAEPVGS